MFDEAFGCYAPTWPVDIEREQRLNVAKFGDGYEQRQLDGINALETTWKLKWVMRPRQVIEDMATYLEDLQAGAFQFYDPSSQTLVWVYCDKWSVSWDHKGQTDQYGELTAEFRRANGDALLGAGPAYLYVPSLEDFSGRFNSDGSGTAAFTSAAVSRSALAVNAAAAAAFMGSVGATGSGVLASAAAGAAAFIGRGAGAGVLDTDGVGTADFRSASVMLGVLASSAAGAAAFIGATGATKTPPVLRLSSVGAVAATFSATQFNPPANIRLVAFADAYRNGGNVTGEPKVTSTVGSGTNPTWTKLAEVHTSDVTAPDLWSTVYISSDLGATPPTGLVLTVSLVSGTTTGVVISAVSVLSSEVSGSAVQSASGEDLTNGDPSFSFAAAPGTDRIVLGHNWHGGSATIVPPTGYTELEDVLPLSARRSELFYDVTSANQSGNQSTSSNIRSVVVAVELASEPPNEFEAVRRIAPNADFINLLTQRANTGMVDVSGACGGNIPTYLHAAEQREAFWLEARGTAQISSTQIADVVRAYDYGFANQNAGGYFNNTLGVTPPNAVGSDAFFVAFFARHWLFQVANNNSGTVTTWSSALANAVNWIEANTSTLAAQDAAVANRKFVDGVALRIGGALVSDSAAVTLGNSYIDSALAMQNAAGWFMEKGGWDSSYNAFSLIQVAVLYMYETNATRKAQLLTAYKASLAWEKSRILGTGEVDATGNTRTGPGSPEGKQINYPEVAYALFLAGSLLGDSDALAKAKLVTDYYIANGSNPGLPGAPVFLQNAVGTTSATTASGTPQTNKRLLVFGYSYRTGGVAANKPTISDSIGTAFSELGSVHTSNVTTADMWLVAWLSSDVGASPAARTTTVASASASGTGIVSYSIVTEDTVGSARQTATGEDLTAGDPSFTFASTPSVDTLAVGCTWMVGVNAVAPPTGYTELNDAPQGGVGEIATFYCSGSAPIGPNALTSTNTRSLVLAIELNPGIDGGGSVNPASSFATSGRGDAAFVGSSGFSYVNTEASAYVEAGVTNGATQPNAGQKTNIDNLFTALKAGAISGSNILAKLDLLYLCGAHDENLAVINAKNPASNKITKTIASGSIPFTYATGWESANIAETYLNTNYIPGSGNFVLNSAHFGGWNLAAGDNSGNMLAHLTQVNFLNPRHLGNTQARLNSSSNVTVSGQTDGSGHFVQSRLDSTNQPIYQNGVLLFAGTGTSNSISTDNLRIAGGVAGGDTKIRIFAAHNGAGLTANEIRDLYNALAAYKAGLSALPKIFAASGSSTARFVASTGPAPTGPLAAMIMATSGRVGYWPCNEASGYTFFGELVAGNIATITGSVAPGSADLIPSGPNKAATSTAGTLTYGLCSNTDLFNWERTQARSIEFVIKMTAPLAAAGQQVILGRYNRPDASASKGWRVEVRYQAAGNTEIGFSQYASYFGSQSATKSGILNIADGAAHHCMITYDGSGSTFTGTNIYVDGILLTGRTLGTDTGSVLTTDASARFALFGHYDGAAVNTKSLGATIEHIALYDRALTASEVALHAQASTFGINHAPDSILVDGLTTVLRSSTLPIGSLIGAITSHDPDGNSVVVTEIADPDNKFAVSGSNLVTTATFNYATKTSHTVTLRATDNGLPTPLTFDQIITVNLLDGAVTATSLSTDGGEIIITETFLALETA